MENAISRKEAYRIIDTERDFQERLIKDPTRPDMIEDLHVGDVLTAIDYNLSKAREAWYKEATPHTATTEYLRKVASLCVQCFERYGVPERK